MLIHRKIAMRVIPLLFVCYLFNYLDRVNVGFAKLQMLADLDMSETVYGLGAGIFFLGYVASGVPSNLILQRLGARRWITVMMVAWGALSAAMMFVTTPTGFYSLRLMTGVAEAGFFPGIVLYLTAWFPRAHLGRVMTLFMSAIPVSGVLGGPASGWILAHFAAGQGHLAAWQWLFLLQGLPTVVLGIVVWWMLDDDVASSGWLDAAEKHALHDAMARDEPTRWPNAAGSFSAALRTRAVWRLGLIYFCIQSGVYAINFWLPTIIRNSGQHDPLLIGLMSAIPYLATLIFMLAMGRSADRRRERRWHLMAPLAMGATGLMIAATASSNPLLSLSGMTLATMGALTGLPMFWPLANGFLSATAAAGGFALINSSGQIAGFFSPYMVGWVQEATGSTQAALYVLAGAMLSGMILVLRTPRT